MISYPEEEVPRLRVAELYVYPLKSGRGVEVQSFKLTPRGPDFDRVFALVDQKTGMFLSQRTHPGLAQIEISHQPDLDRIVCRKPGMNDDLPVPFGAVRKSKTRKRTFTIHNDSCTGLDLGAGPARWFSEALSTKCRLVRYMPEAPRIREASSLGRTIEVSYADGYPLLVVSRESLHLLNERLEKAGKQPVSAEQFRPNIVVKGCEAHEEETWGTVKIGDTKIRGAKRCARCAIVTTDQKTGARLGSEPLRTIAKHQKKTDGDRNIYFGMNFGVVEVSKPNLVCVGDDVILL